MDLSSKGSEDVLEDPDDEPVLKKRISYSNEEESVPPETEFMGMCLSPFLFFFFSPNSFFPLFCHLLPYMYVFMSPLFATISLYLYTYFPVFVETFEGPGVATNVGMPSAAAPATPIVPVFAIPTVPVSAVPSVPVFVIPTAPIPTGPGEFLISSLISFSQVYCS